MNNQRLSSTVAAFMWPLWSRNRLVYILGALGLVVFAAIAHAATRSAPGSEARSFLMLGPTSGFLASAAYFLLSLALASTVIGYQAFGINGQPTGRDSTFQRNPFTLPVTTSTLISIVGFTFLWVIYAVSTQMPFEIYRVPIHVPLLAGFGVLGSMQAIFWLGNWIQVFAGLLPLPMAIPILAGFILVQRRSESSYSIILASIVAASLWTGVWASPRARNGWRTRRVPPTRPRSHPARIPDGPANKSAWKAHFWWQRGPKYSGVLVPTVFQALIVGVFMVAVSAVPRPSIVNAQDERFFVPLGLGAIRIDPLMIALLPLLPNLVLLFAAMNCNTGLMSMLNGTLTIKDPGMPPFFAARPISTAQFVGSRLAVALLSALIISPVLILFAAKLLAIPAFENGVSGTTGELLAKHIGAGTPTFTGILVICTPLLVWSLGGGNPITRPAILRHSMVFAGVLLAGSASVISLCARLFPSVSQHLLSALPIVGWTWLVAKSVLAARALGRLINQRLIEQSTCAIALASWFGAWILLTAGFFTSLPPGCISLWTLAMMIAILLPANRFLWLILNLDSVRHG